MKNKKWSFQNLQVASDVIDLKIISVNANLNTKNRVLSRGSFWVLNPNQNHMDPILSYHEFNGPIDLTSAWLLYPATWV